jgi:hypothetical protein
MNTNVQVVYQTHGKLESPYGHGNIVLEVSNVTFVSGEHSENNAKDFLGI